MLAQLVEVVERGAVDGVGPRNQLLRGDGLGCGREIAVTVVGAVDANRLEDRAELLDLAQEVLGGEATFPELARKRVRRRDDGHAARGKLREEAGYEHGVARIVELELVDAENAVVGERFDRLVEAESADDVCQLDEGSESLRRRNAVEDRRQQVSLTDTEPAVEVQAGAGRLGLLAEQSAASTTTDLGYALGEFLGLGDSSCLARFLRIRNVGRKTHLVEHCGRHHLSYQLIGGYHRAAIDKTFMHPSRVST